MFLRRRRVNQNQHVEEHVEERRDSARRHYGWSCGLPAYLLIMPMVLVFLLNEPYLGALIVSNFGSAEERGPRIVFSIKTTASNIKTRLAAQESTWIPYAQSLGHIVMAVSDSLAKERETSTAVRLVQTECGIGHDARFLCCKLGYQLQEYCEDSTQHGYWWCAIDDDTYVIVPRLVAALKEYVDEPAYVGHYRSFIAKKGDIQRSWDIQRSSFANGGAGYCLSPLAMSQVCNDNRAIGPEKFMNLCREKHCSDDTSFGLFMKDIGVNLTDLPGLHSHLDLPWFQFVRNLRKARDVHSMLGQFVTYTGCTENEMQTIHCILDPLRSDPRNCTLHGMMNCSDVVQYRNAPSSVCQVDELTIEAGYRHA